jgi:hypothetical protein
MLHVIIARTPSGIGRPLTLALACLAACGGSARSSTADGANADLLGGPHLDARCVQASFASHAAPLAMYFMVDQSFTMSDPVPSDPVPGGETKFSAVQSAMQSFFQSPQSAGMSAGLQFFGLPVAVTGGLVNDSCSSSDYAKPNVEIGLLPANADALAASFQAHAPAGSTPTDPALEGAVEHAAAWATANPGHVPAVVLVSDGNPWGCSSSTASSAAIAAKAAAGSTAVPGVLTFAVGIGSNAAGLDLIAAGGGTGHAYYVDDSGALSDAFLAALESIRVAAPCVYAIPEPDTGTVDLAKVNVTYDGSVIGQLAGARSCTAAGGWYYDPPDEPRTIDLCSSTCQAIFQLSQSATSASANGVDIALGCQTQAVQ